MADIEYVKANDVVIVASGNHPRNRQAQRYVVTKVARVWITVRPEGDEDRNHWLDKRFRLDDHTDGSGIGAPDRFYTLGEWAAREREDAADVFLRDQGIQVGYDSPWRARKAELADIIRRAVKPADDSEVA